MAWMIRGFPSIMETWSMQESVDAIDAVKECMPQEAYKEIYPCMHFSDDWELEEGELWDKIYSDERYEALPDTAQHRRKYEHIKDGFNRRWKACVNFG